MADSISRFQPTQRFTSRVGDYAKYRPSYPAELFDDLDRLVWNRTSTVADVGAGTGLFTRRVADRVALVYALEPNEAMRRQGEGDSSGHSNIVWREGTAETTGLDDGCLDVLTCAQAFHWFDRAACALEWRRVLKPSAPVVLVWNDRDETSPFHAEYNALLNRWCPDFAATNHKTIAPADIGRFFAPHPVNQLTHRNDQRFDLEGWKGRLRSASYCPVEGSEGWNALVEGITTLFVRYREADGRMTFPYVTKAYVGRLV